MQSASHKALQQTHIFGESLVYKEEEEEGQTSALDLDDTDGVNACKSYLVGVENLIKSMGIRSSEREYRETFTHSYQVLYQQMREEFMSELGYLPEVLDSAQEGFDHLWVNGEKYIFSEHVIESGTMLFTHFCILKETISEFYEKHFGERKHESRGFADELEHLGGLLQRFDELWCTYEQKYVFELMVIENDARRFIIESVNIESILSQSHMNSILKKKEFNENRENLLQKICQVNAVANEEGKGKESFKFEILMTAEELLGAKTTQSFRGFSNAV